jgi:hypothetical protein
MNGPWITTKSCVCPHVENKMITALDYHNILRYAERRSSCLVDDLKEEAEKDSSSLNSENEMLKMLFQTRDDISDVGVLLNYQPSNYIQE